MPGKKFFFFFFKLLQNITLLWTDNYEILMDLLLPI